jgi:hypothetical protein
MSSGAVDIPLQPGWRKMAKNKTRIAACIVGLLRHPKGQSLSEMRRLLRNQPAATTMTDGIQIIALASASIQYHLANLGAGGFNGMRRRSLCRGCCSTDD